MRRQGTQCSLAEEAVSSGSRTTHADGKELFQELLDRLRDCHDNALQELQSKVNKLRKERCFDAQRLEEFYNKNQHLREQQRALQESVSVLKDRLKSGPCDQCRETARHMKEKQSVFENLPNLQLVNELVAERDALKEENKKLRLQLKRLQSAPLHTSVSEPEEGMIPDSPVQPMSFPTVNKMKRKREKSHVRYAEKRLSQPLPDLRKGEPAMGLSSHGGAVLVPETCDLYSRINGRTVVGETCGIDDYCEQGSECDEDSRTFLYAVDEQEQMEKDCSVESETPSVRERFSCRGAEMQEARKKKDSPKSPVLKNPVEQINAQEPSKKRSRQPEQIRPDSPPPCTPRKDPLVSQNGSPYDQSWSLDPEASLSQYDISTPNHPEPRVHSVNTDMDCTYVSHSLLVASRKQAELDQANSVTGLGLIANDSLANIFDATSVEEYESCPQGEMSGVDDEHDHEDEQSEEMNEQKQQGVQEEEPDLMNEHFDRPSIQARETPARADPEKSFACMVVVRKKAERRKLQGHTCKECEIYYADLPEEQRKKKLSSCSRHRFRYIPPPTPENFWEVGFPSTQTCKERGYIKEDNQPDPRLRRRKPYHATFSPKAKELDS